MPRRQSALRGGLFGSYVYFNHTDGNYLFNNTMSGEGDVINTSGQTTLNGDLSALKANVTARAVKSLLPAT